MSKKLLILGQGRMGKDTVAEILRDKFGMSFSSSSEFACKKFIFEELKEEFGYTTAEECYFDRHNHRDLWFNLISGYNEQDPSRLAKMIVEDNDIYVGMRSSIELQQCIEDKVFDYILYVDASERVSYYEPKSSNNIDKSKADLIMYNNGTIKELEDKVEFFYNEVLHYGI